MQLSTDNIIALGIMSGTSLDGIDMALCRFSFRNRSWSYKTIACKKVEYTKEWKEKLSGGHKLDSKKLLLLHNEYGSFTGAQITNFLKGKAHPDIIASHGHTIFHEPEARFTFQLGNGANIAASTKVTTICDFRSLDVALGGQGAPLVPIGDMLLFSEYMYCLNLGGFANISYDRFGKRVAYDICPVNIAINHMAQKAGVEFDNNGNIGKKGEVENTLLRQLNSISFYSKKPPKSLGREWLEKSIIPLLETPSISIESRIRTLYEHIALQISRSVSGEGRLLVTGGGARNTFLMERIKELCGCEVVIPPPETADYKEAIIFGFLGTLAYLEKPNCLASVTGAKTDSISGAIYRA